MFKSLVKKLFRAPSRQPQLSTSFTQSSTVAPKATVQKPQLTAVQNQTAMGEFVVETPEQSFQNAFYDFLFGKGNSHIQADELTLYIAEQVQILSSKPDEILESMPVLPASMAQIIEQLKDQDFDSDRIVQMLNQEPVIAAKVIQLANSMKYNRTGKDVTSLKHAFLQLGVSGLSEGVINGFISKMVPQNNVYFKYYGQRIWQYSMETGDVARQLIAGSEIAEQADQAYLIGMFCNLGDIVLYQLLLDAFSVVHPDCQPSSTPFKNLMRQKAKGLSFEIARHWDFPKSMLLALEIQAKLSKSSMLKAGFEKYPLACFIYEARLISKLKLRIDHRQATDEDIRQAQGLVHSRQAKSLLNDILLKHLESLETC